MSPAFLKILILKELQNEGKCCQYVKSALLIKIKIPATCKVG